MDAGRPLRELSLESKEEGCVLDQCRGNGNEWKD